MALANDFLFERSQFLTAKTLSGYQFALQFYSFLSLSDFERKDFVAYLRKKADKSWTRRTLEHKLKILVCFGNWLCDNHHTQNHLRFRQIHKPVQRDMPENFEIDLIFEQLKKNYLTASPKRRFCNLQRYLVTRVIYETGCRISEACNLYFEDVRLRNHQWFILLRGTKTESSERTVLISDELFQELNDYRNVYELDGRIFSSSWGNAFSAEQYSRWLAKFCKNLKISCHIHPHLFRYLFIVRWFRDGKDGIELSHRLGHSSIQMTYYYAKQVQRICHDIDLSESISILERQKSLNAWIYNEKNKKETKLYE